MSSSPLKSVPPVEKCSLIGQKAIASYPAREEIGAIFLYFSNGTSDEVPELYLPEQLSSPEWSAFLHAAEWQCNWQIPLENRLDPMHAPFLHAVSFTLSYGVKQSVLLLHETETGFVIERDNQIGVNIDREEVTYRPGNNYWITSQVPYPKCVGGGFFGIVSHVTPIDDKRTYFWVYRCRKTSGWQRDMWHFLYKNRLNKRHFDVLEQDREIMEGIPADVRSREVLIQSDVGIARMRRMLRQNAEEQIRVMKGT